MSSTLTLMASRSLQQQLTDRAYQTEALLRNLRAQLAILRSASTLEGRRDCVEQANANLKRKIEQLKLELSDIEIRNGRRQVFISSPIVALTAAPAAPNVAAQKLPSEASAVQCTLLSPPAAAAAAPTKSSGEEKSLNIAAPAASAATKGEKKGGGRGAAAGGGENDDVLDVRRLDMRVGKIIECAAHPDADTLYVEKVDLGEVGGPRTIVSGLRRNVPLEAMQGRRAVFLLNLKAAKMRGVLSQGMIMCANLDGKVEILEVPESAQPGDLIFVEGYPRQPDEQLNPKKKIFETLKPDLRVNAEGLACFRGAVWHVALSDGTRQVVKSSLKDSQIS